MLFMKNFYKIQGEPFDRTVKEVIMQQMQENPAYHAVKELQKKSDFEYRPQSQKNRDGSLYFVIPLPALRQSGVAGPLPLASPLDRLLG